MTVNAFCTSGHHCHLLKGTLMEGSGCVQSMLLSQLRNFMTYTQTRSDEDKVVLFLILREVNCPLSTLLVRIG